MALDKVGPGPDPPGSQLQQSTHAAQQGHAACSLPEQRDHQSQGCLNAKNSAPIARANRRLGLASVPEELLPCGVYPSAPRRLSKEASLQRKPTTVIIRNNHGYILLESPSKCKDCEGRGHSFSKMQ